jgi:hypothetical protein
LVQWSGIFLGKNVGGLPENWFLNSEIGDFTLPKDMKVGKKSSDGCCLASHGDTAMEKATFYEI